MGGALGNTAHGVMVEDGAENNQIGGAIGITLLGCTGDCNQIAFNGGDGIFITDTKQIFMGFNSIFDNDGLGVNINHAVDNNSIVAPQITAVAFNSAPNNFNVSLQATGSVSSSHTLQVFENAACDASTNGEGKTLLASQELTTDAAGLLTTVLTMTATPESFTTALIIDNVTGDTSEFSNCVQLPAAPIVVATPTPTAIPLSIPTPVATSAAESGDGTTNTSVSTSGGCMIKPSTSSNQNWPWMLFIIPASFLILKRKES